MALQSLREVRVKYPATSISHHILKLIEYMDDIRHTGIVNKSIYTKIDTELAQIHSMSGTGGTSAASQSEVNDGSGSTTYVSPETLESKLGLRYKEVDDQSELTSDPTFSVGFIRKRKDDGKLYIKTASGVEHLSTGAILAAASAADVQSGTGGDVLVSSVYRSDQNKIWGGVADLTELNGVANPQIGWRRKVLDSDLIYTYNGTAWEADSTPITEASSGDVVAGADSEKFISSLRLREDQERGYDALGDLATIQALVGQVKSMIKKALDTNAFYIYNGATYERLTVQLINDLTTGGTNSALTAQQGVVLRNLIEGIGERISVEDNAAMVADSSPDGQTYFVINDNGTGKWGMYQRIAGADQFILGQDDLATAILALTDLQALDETNTDVGLIAGGKQLYDAIIKHSTSITKGNLPVADGTRDIPFGNQDVNFLNMGSFKLDVSQMSFGPNIPPTDSDIITRVLGIDGAGDVKLANPLRFTVATGVDDPIDGGTTAYDDRSLYLKHSSGELFIAIRASDDPDDSPAGSKWRAIRVRREWKETNGTLLEAIPGDSWILKPGHSVYLTELSRFLNDNGPIEVAPEVGSTWDDTTGTIVSNGGNIPIEASPRTGKSIYHFIYDKPNNKWVQYSGAAPQEDKSGLRGEPVDTLTDLTALTARPFELRLVKGTGEFAFKLTADLTASENADSANVSDDANTGKWVKQFLITGPAVERITTTRNRNSTIIFGDLQFRVPSSGLSSLQMRVGSGSMAISHFTTYWSNQQGGASEQSPTRTIGTGWSYFRSTLNLTQHNNMQNATFVANGWVYHVELIVGLSYINNRFSFTRWRQEGIKGDAGANGVDGINGTSVDHVSQTAGDSSPGTSNTYTQWGDAAETVNLGDFDIPIPTPADAAKPLEDLIAEGTNGSSATDETITLSNGKTWNDLITDGYEKVFISAKEDSWRGKNIGGYYLLSDLIRDGGVEIWTVASGSNRYEVTISNVTGTGTTFTVINGTGGHSFFKMWGVRPQKELLVVSPTDAVVDTDLVGTPLQAGSKREGTLQYDGSKIVNRLTIETWTTGNLDSTGYRQYIANHLTGFLTIIGRVNITSTGSVALGYTFANTHYNFSPGSINTSNDEGPRFEERDRTTSTVIYVLYDESGTGNSGTEINYRVEGKFLA